MAVPLHPTVSTAFYTPAVCHIPSAFGCPGPAAGAAGAAGAVGAAAAAGLGAPDDLISGRTARWGPNAPWPRGPMRTLPRVGVCRCFCCGFGWVNGGGTGRTWQGMGRVCAPWDSDEAPPMYVLTRVLLEPHEPPGQSSVCAADAESQIFFASPTPVPLLENRPLVGVVFRAGSSAQHVPQPSTLTPEPFLTGQTALPGGERQRRISSKQVSYDCLLAVASPRCDDGPH